MKKQMKKKHFNSHNILLYFINENDITPFQIVQSNDIILYYYENNDLKKVEIEEKENRNNKLEKIKILN